MPDDRTVHVLQELRKRYASHPAGSRSLWSEQYVAREIDLKNFRSDNAYIWQRSHGAETYVRSYTWLCEHEPTLLARCREDGAFGASTVPVDGRLVSRDLLDSVAELGFLIAELGDLDGLSALDIGAGYGRLAHRAYEALPGLTYTCTDGVPESTLISQKYLAYRGAARVSIVPLDEISAYVETRNIDVAINIHSFPECPSEAIEWWLHLLADHGIRYLFLVPNEIDELITTEKNGDRRDFRPLLKKYGYRLEAMRLKYRDRTREDDEWLFQDAHLLYVHA
jgi:SAM-dependent methyltransferase